MIALPCLGSAGQHVEVRGLEEGFLGSWYAARVLEAREARSSIRLRLCYLAFQEEDGSFWEDWLDLQHVRPMPPDHVPGFITELKKGAPLEINIEEGWWEVELCGREGAHEGAQYVVESRRYKVQHTVPLSQLRPAWKWSQEERAWTQLRKPPPAPSKAEGKSSAKRK